MTKLTLFVTVLILAVFIKEGESVRCWTCSSDISPFCNDPFLSGRSDESYFFKLENCDANAAVSYPYLASSKSACKKQKRYINNQLVVTRGCTWKRQEDYNNICPSAANGNNEVTLFCETCDYDGCNGAATIVKTMALFLAPLCLLLFK